MPGPISERRAPTRRSIAPKTRARRARPRPHYKVSPLHLRVPTLGELMKAQVAREPQRRGVGQGPLRGDDERPRRRPALVLDRQASSRRDLERAHAAQRLRGPMPRSPRRSPRRAPALDPPPFCAAKAQVIPLEGGGKPVGNGRVRAGRGRCGGVPGLARRPTPRVLALSAALIQDMQLGSHASPDIISVGLAATDYVGHTYGTGGQEMCLQLLSLDRDVGDFLAVLDRWGIDYAVALTADHGGLDIPERLRLHGVADAARIDPALTPKAVGDAVARQTGIAGPILANVGVTGDLYLDSHLQGADRQRALDAALAIYRAHPQVAAAFSKDEIASTPMPSGDPVDWSRDPARPRFVRRRAFGRSLCRAQAARHADCRHHRARRDARQPVGL